VKLDGCRLIMRKAEVEQKVHLQPGSNRGTIPTFLRESFMTIAEEFVAKIRAARQRGDQDFERLYDEISKAAVDFRCACDKEDCEEDHPYGVFGIIYTFGDGSEFNDRTDTALPALPCFECPTCGQMVRIINFKLESHDYQFDTPCEPIILPSQQSLQPQ
jgi:hypothetical protein